MRRLVQDILSSSGYKDAVLQAIPQLEALDGVDRQGQAACIDEVLADIPGVGNQGFTRVKFLY